jgi:hypothetical protein
MIQFDSKTLKQFEDLLDDESVAVNFEEKENLEDEEALMNKLDANSLTLKDLLHEMEMRNLQPRGFFEDDAKLLQERLDKEHEEYLELKQRQKIEAKELEASQALVRRRKALQEIELGEEKREYGCNKRTSEWFRLLENKCSPSRCRIDINNVSARTLSRILWSDTLIVTLDVCNMYIADHAGSYLARVLKNNKSLIKLEMDENNLGYKTCNTLADSLGTNSTLKYLSLGSNPLTANNGKEVVESLAKILVENKSLQYLGLWRCNIGIEGGRKVSEAMQSNKDILCFELGYNFWDYKEIQNIQHVLVRMILSEHFCNEYESSISFAIHIDSYHAISKR